MIRNENERDAVHNGVEPVPDHLLTQWTARLTAGETGNEADEIARAVLQDFVLRQWLGQPQSAVTLAWLADALDSILNHADPMRTLGLAHRPAKRPADPRVAIDVAMWVALTETRGYARAKAKEMAAGLFHRDAKTIERYMKRAAGWVAGMNRDHHWDEYFLTRKPPRPLPRPRDEK